MDEPQGPWRRPPPPADPAPPARPRFALWLVVIAAAGLAVLALAHAFPEALQTQDDWASLAYRVLLLAVVSTAVLRMSRGAVGRHLKSVAVWAVVVAAAALGFAYRGELSGVGEHLRLAFSQGDPVVTGERELVVPQDDEGAFVVVGQVNGQRVRFVVDTGATDTVLSPADARRLGIDVDRLSYDDVAETANGMGRGARLVADRIEVGPIRFDHFPMTINQAPMSTSLLGMSFLRRLESFEHRQGRLELRWRDPAQPAGIK